MVSIPEQGELKPATLAELMVDLSRAQFCGRLSLSHDRCQKSFLFDRGAPIFAESNLASESLGVQLLDAQKITRVDYSKVVAVVSEKKCKEGAALLELGLIQPRELFDALKAQLRIRLLECFGWPRGEFSIDPNEKPPSDAHPFRTEPCSLVQEGIETHWSSDRVLVELQSAMAMYPNRTNRLAGMQQRIRCDEGVEAFLERLDGSTTLWQALQNASTPQSMAAAWVLIRGGAIELKTEPKKSGESDDIFDLEVVIAEAPTAASRRRAAPRPDRPFEAGLLFEQEVLDRFENLEQLNHYELLGVEASAETSEIRSAYLKAAKTYHPDALAKAQLEESVRKKAGKVFAAIGKAHAILSKPETRRNYDASINSDGSEIDANRLANAETLYRKGEVLLRQGNFRGAMEFLAPAVQLWPDEADYQSALGWALYKKMPSEAEAAKEHLEAAMALAPDDAVVVFRLSIVLRALGDAVAGTALLERARQLDPQVS